MKNILSEEINHHEQKSIESKKKKTKKTKKHHYILNSLRPLDFEIITYRI